MLLVGAGATRFAHQNGVAVATEADLVTEEARAELKSYHIYQNSVDRYFCGLTTAFSTNRPGNSGTTLSVALLSTLEVAWLQALARGYYHLPNETGNHR
jgi:isoaspartyl peptidase/L-asparaginase-like protein (Ntn-hydrolase superfamily)